MDVNKKDRIVGQIHGYDISQIVFLSAKADSPLNFHLAEIRFTVLLATSFRFPIGNYEVHEY